MLVYKKLSIYFAIELGSTEISFIVYVHTLHDAKIVRSRIAQCNIEESPLTPS